MLPSLRVSLVLLCITCFSLVTGLIAGPGFCKSGQESSGYRIGPEDVLTISILAGGETQVETQMVVGSNGYVNVPFIGKIKAGGRTMEALEKAIIIPLEADYFVNPQVHLQIKEYHSVQFFIAR